jgi:hypothetical protein
MTKKFPGFNDAHDESCGKTERIILLAGMRVENQRAIVCRQSVATAAMTSCQTVTRAAEVGVIGHENVYER